MPGRLDQFHRLVPPLPWILGHSVSPVGPPSGLPRVTIRPVTPIVTRWLARMRCVRTGLLLRCGPISRQECRVGLFSHPSIPGRVIGSIGLLETRVSRDSKGQFARHRKVPTASLSPTLNSSLPWLYDSLGHFVRASVVYDPRVAARRLTDQQHQGWAR